jgi:putative membrane protein
MDPHPPPEVRPSSFARAFRRAFSPAYGGRNDKERTMVHLVAHNWHGDHWWVVFPVLWLLLTAVVIALVWRRSRGGGDSGRDSARRILGERFARGEIGVEEYQTRLGQLQ